MESIRPLTNELVPVACQLETTQEGLQIYCRGDGGYAVTPLKYQVPLTIETIVKTDSTNIRLKFHQGQIILNWEANLDELRWHDPKTGNEIGIANKGRVPENEWVSVTWNIDNNVAVLLVDGEERCHFEGDFGNIAGQVGIGAAHGSKVTLKSFQVNGVISELGSEITGPPRMRWDGGYIFVRDEKHEEAVEWYSQHFGLTLKWPTWKGKQDPHSETEKMSSLEFAEGGLIHLKSSTSSKRLSHFYADWEANDANVRFSFHCPDLNKAYAYFQEQGIQTSEIYHEPAGRECFDVHAFDGVRHTLRSCPDQTSTADRRVTTYGPWRIGVPNLNEAAAWYKDVLGLQVIQDGAAHGFVEMEGNFFLNTTSRCF